MKMENKSQLFKLCCNVLKKLSEGLSVNTLIQFNGAYDNESHYMFKNEINDLYYVKGWNGEMTSSSVIDYYCSYYKKEKATELESNFKFYKGDIKEQVETNCESENIIWYDMFECGNGEYNWKREIRSKQDLIDMLENIYNIQEYGYSIEELI